MIRLIVVSALFSAFCSCASTIDVQFNGFSEIEAYQIEVETWLRSIDSYFGTFNSLQAYITWMLTVNPTEKLEEQASELGEARNSWRNRVCESKIKTEWLTNEQNRKLYLLCRGPKYSDGQFYPFLLLLGALHNAYSEEICLPQNEQTPLQLLSMSNQNTSYYPKPGDCLQGEPDLERLIKENGLNPEQKKWIWKIWHDTAGAALKQIYPVAIMVQNIAAKNNGYNDIGEAWREELEIPGLEEEVFQLYNEIKSLYTLLHAVMRHKLYLKYGDKYIDPKGPIPIHFLGDMWGQDWSYLLHLFVPEDEIIDLNKRLRNKQWTVTDMVQQAEDMYASFGLPRMTSKFWNYSIFEETENLTMCHGTAANLYNHGDFRMLICGKVNMEDFYVIHHEMGHIQYYMAYKDQPAIFQDGANSALHESIGDAIMHGVMTPQHLYRLGLLNDDEISNSNVAFIILLQQALAKIPEIPFSLLIDKYRWDIFRGKIKPTDYNKVYWKLNLEYRGVIPPEERTEQYFDAGAKFHIPDNTPYIRYFLSSIMQMQIFKGMCETTFYGSSDSVSDVEETHLILPLHKCDIYGSKKSGKRLKKMMEKGASIDWATAMEILTGKAYISTKPLLEYYRPVYQWLETYVSLNKVHMGW